MFQSWVMILVETILPEAKKILTWKQTNAGNVEAAVATTATPSKY